MNSTRKDFLKLAGMVGIGAAGGIILPACRSDTDSSDTPLRGDWITDPEWREVKYGDWGGPGVPSGPGPMDEVLLKDYAPRSSLVTQETFIQKAQYGVIDVHIHNYPDRVENVNPREILADWVRTMDEVGVEISVVLTGATGAEFDRLVEMYLEPHPDRFQLYCGLETKDINKSDYPERTVTELERCYGMGARGIGELSDKGFGLTRDPNLAPDERLHPDDPRLDGFWEKAAELNMPVNMHIADHPSAWEAPDVFQERTPIYQQFNQHNGEGVPYDRLQEFLPRLLEKHPDTTFIACHLANLGNDLGRLSKLLDQHSNLYLDISARDYEIGRQPRGAAKFLGKYQDRVLFGTDMGMDKSMYQAWWRLLESADEHMEGRVWWRYYGLELPAPVLESLYRTNAKRIMNWEKI